MTLSGIVSVNKPSGWTSFDVVRFVRGRCGVKRVGHAGTLDPGATGVLPILLGSATRLTEYLVDDTKEYFATIELGVSTDTYDADGEEVGRTDVSSVTEENLREALSAFLGEISQVPPAFSAIKREGVPLYKRARRGETVRADPRPVRVEELDIISYLAPYLELRIVCGKGFYVRSLAHDLGNALGVGGRLNALTRSRVGRFKLVDAIDIESLRAAFEDGTWVNCVEAPDEVLLGWRAAILGEASAEDLLRGRYTAVRAAPGVRTAPGDVCRAYSDSGEFLAILRCLDIDVWRAEKVLTSTPDRI